jgi:dextranase
MPMRWAIPSTSTPSAPSSRACRSGRIADALGYAAVYGVGATTSGRAGSSTPCSTRWSTAYALGDFLRVVTDPATPDWLAHFTADLAAAVEAVGFDGFHLDQYGWPKRRRRPDGRLVDLAERFPR